MTARRRKRSRTGAKEAGTGADVPALRRRAASLERQAQRAREEAGARKRETAKLREVTAELKHTSGNLQTVLDHMSDGIMLFGRDFRWQLYNRNLCDFQRFPPEIGHIGADGDDILRYQALRGDFGPITDLEKMIEERRNLIMSASGAKYVRRTASGRMVEFQFKPLPDGRVLGVYRDISDVHRAEERHEAALRAINEGVYDWDIADGTTYYSERVYTVLGLSADDFRTPEGWRARIHPDDLARYDAALVAHFKGQTDRFECDYRYRARDGSWLWARQHGIAIRDERGRAVRLIGSTGDITELKRTEEALKESEARYARAMRAATEGIYEWSVETGALYLSDRAREIWGFPSGALTNADWIAHIHPDDFSAYRQAVIGHFKGRTPHLAHEMRARDAHGEYRWVQDRGIAERNREGRVTRLVGATSDVTQRKLAEQALRRAHEETTEALERQTATAEILDVISRSPTDVQPVFNTVAAKAVKLCDASFSVVTRFDGELIHVAATCNMSPEAAAAIRKAFPAPLSGRGATSRAILTRAIVHIPDVMADPEYKPGGLAQAASIRSIVAVPMLRAGIPLGAIAVLRPEPRPFTDQQIALLKSFADQAVIAIENVRLFKELEARTAALAKSVNQLTALGEVGQAISSTLELETVLQTIVSRAVQLSGLDGGSIYEYDERSEEFRLQAAENMDEELADSVRKAPIRKGDGAVGRTGITREPTQVPDIHDESYQSGRRELLVRAGYRAVLAVPLLREDHIIGALAVTRKTPGPFAPEIVELLKTFATQSALAIQNARLFREIAEKGLQLEVASRHKSEFLASMSHELRTPLNAILGFNEMILGQVYGDVPTDMQAPLAEIQSGGKHLLRLINNVLDLAKIEAGRMELSLADYSVQDTVEAVRSTLRPLAAEKGLEFLATVPPDIPLAYGDPGRISQCLVNLAGNSLKFTKAGKVEISVEQKDGLLRYCVADTGIGIPPDKIASLFTEFKQTDATIASEYGGTGLGLSISKKFIEMHGGRIWVESEPGKGSSFIFEVPLRVKGQTAGGAPA